MTREHCTETGSAPGKDANRSFNVDSLKLKSYFIHPCSRNSKVNCVQNACGNHGLDSGSIATSFFTTMNIVHSKINKEINHLSVIQRSKQGLRIMYYTIQITYT